MQSVRLLALGCVFSFLSIAAKAGEPSYIKTDDGIIIYTDPQFTGTSKAVKLEVVSDYIIRVLASPRKDILPTESLVTVYTRDPKLKWRTEENGDKVVLKTKALIAEVNMKTGVVNFS